MLRERTKKAKSSRPRYNMGQNSWFMVKLAWTSGEKKVLVLSLLSALTAAALNLLNLYISPAILSAMERRASVWDLIWAILVFVLALMLVSAVSSYVNMNAIFARISSRAVVTNLLNRKAATTSYPNVDDDHFIKLLTKSRECPNSNGAAPEAIWITLSTLTTNMICFGIYVSLLSLVQPFLIFVILAATVISCLFSNYVNAYGYRHREEAAEYERHMYYISECARDLGAAKDTRIFGLRSWLESLYEKAMDAHTAFHRKAQSVYIAAKIVDLVLTFLRNAAAYAFLIGFVLQNGLGVAEFLLYFTAIGGFTGRVSGIMSDFSALYKQSLDITTIRECLEYEEPFHLGCGKPLKAEADRKYEIRLEQVSFRYPGAGQYALSDINLTLHPGEKLAIVGLNGAGKTTLIKLICGFLNPTEGRVLLDGNDIRDYDRTDYYTMFSAVFQDFSLLAGSIAANVAQNDVGIDMQRVKECVEKAGLSAKIEALPDGYDTCLNRAVYEEATALSGGETQRLMLARALYKNAPFIVLDEPASALDPIAESQIYQKYHAMTSGKSSIYISHRLASTRFCDRIILIDHGGISEEGTHEELLNRGGRYAELYEVQSRYYREGEDEDGEENAVGKDAPIKSSGF